MSYKKDILCERHYKTWVEFDPDTKIGLSNYRKEIGHTLGK